jgi:hypothetical protein
MDHSPKFEAHARQIPAWSIPGRALKYHNTNTRLNRVFTHCAMGVVPLHKAKAQGWRSEQRLLMLIDDEPAQCRLIAALAAREGWRTIIAGDAETAIATLGTRQGMQLTRSSSITGCRATMPAR